MNNQAIILNIGDEIGFVNLASDVDSNDKTIYFPVVEVTEKDGENVYRYMYPDGEISRSYVRQSELKYHSLKINSQAVVQSKPVKSKRICLNERQEEFAQAILRGMKNEFDVFEDFEIGTFVCVNKTNKSEYRVEMETIGNKTCVSCTCKDFEFKRHICKHVAQVLQARMFGICQTA
jgi:hypothetical protein